MRKYVVTKILSDTLQGMIIYGYRISDRKPMIFKVASKILHKNSITITSQGYVVPIKEDIFNESIIIGYLSKKKPHKGFVNVIDFIDDGSSIFIYLFVINIIY